MSTFLSLRGTKTEKKLSIVNTYLCYGGSFACFDPVDRRNVNAVGGVRLQTTNRYPGVWYVRIDTQNT